MVVLGEKDLEKLKSLQLEMFKIFIKICDKYSLRYYLNGGTCLGAVRHKGFIPWDDDIDVGMPRPDYERFMEIAESELPDCYFLQNSKTDPDFPMGFAKIRACNTTFIESTVSHLNINHGVYFDIFPLDGYCTKPLFKLKRKLYVIAVSKIFNNKSAKKGLKKFIVGILSSLIPDYRVARDKLIILTSGCSYDKYEMVANYYGAWGEKEVFPREKCLGEGSVGMFEGISVVLPADPDDYCTRLYGDYMKLPPEDKRVTHHYCDVIDLDRSYLEYINKGKK